MGRQPHFCQPVFFCTICKGEVPVVNKQLIMAFSTPGRTRLGNVYIEKAISIYSGQADPRRPDSIGSQDGLFRNILKLIVASVQVETIRNLVARQKNIGKAVPV